jgi:hypothetical protein
MDSIRSTDCCHEVLHQLVEEGAVPVRCGFRAGAVWWRELRDNETRVGAPWREADIGRVEIRERRVVLIEGSAVCWDGTVRLVIILKAVKYDKLLTGLGQGVTYSDPLHMDQFRAAALRTASHPPLQLQLC